LERHTGGTTTIPSFYSHKVFALTSRGHRRVQEAASPCPNRSDRTD
jgi:hypothetical protein